MTKLTTPISEATTSSLKVGDEVQITGTLFTGREMWQTRNAALERGWVCDRK